MFNELIELIAREFNVEKSRITKDTDIQNDLGADSLDAVELVMSIEDTFHISLPDNAVKNFKTVNDIFTFLQEMPVKLA